MAAQEESPAQSSPQHAQTTNNNDNNDPLLSSIRQLVTQTNKTLSSFEQSTVESSTTLVSRLSSLASQIRHVASKAVVAYDHRGYYGPQICAGAALLVGGVVGMRRGKAVGALAGGVGGLAAYENVYGLGSAFGGKNDWRDKIQRSGQ
ncbi:hypothetical protein ACHAWO_009288 [Cyclotella atomus]|uniref:Glycine zipper 2TM domain-containing protein n=1 Tax=Cyclotella atomus TaxID=382360 RepID=A0ABD3NHB8_9STRA